MITAHLGACFPLTGLRARRPARHASLGINGEDGVIGGVVDDEAQALLAFAPRVLRAPLVVQSGKAPMVTRRPRPPTR